MASKTNVKCVLVGDGDVGKTCLGSTYATNTFPTENVPTVFEYFMLDRQIDGKEIALSIWDTSGLEHHDRMRPLYYPNANVILICFSLVSPTSFGDVEGHWIAEINHHIPQAHVILVGTKLDLRDDKNTIEKLLSNQMSPVTQEQGQKMALKIGACAYMECSSLTQQGVKELFDQVMRVGITSKADTSVNKEKCSVM